jgi:hypothetical protein
MHKAIDGKHPPLSPHAARRTPRTPLVARRIAITDQLMLLTRALPGGPVFPGSSTTPSMTERG